MNTWKKQEGEQAYRVEGIGINLPRGGRPQIVNVRISNVTEFCIIVACTRRSNMAVRTLCCGALLERFRRAGNLESIIKLVENPMNREVCVRRTVVEKRSSR